MPNCFHIGSSSVKWTDHSMNNVWLLTQKKKSKVKDLQLSQIRKYAEYFDEDVKEEIVNKKNLTLTLWLISAIYAIYLFIFPRTR